MRKALLLVLLIFIGGTQFVMSQPTTFRQPDGGGNYADLIEMKDEITPVQRAAIIAMLHENETILRSQGKLQAPLTTVPTLFSWPLKQAAGFNDNGYYGISNYIDHNANFPNAILDYNCGNRSYDLATGYNHKGTDIFTWPFYWQKMDRNAVEVIAGAAGVIIGKSDGNYDKNCTFCVTTCDWNAVYLMHADGSVAWYGHLKSGSLTNKAIGESIATGEYIGIVGSSGNSTGPHLHFEVYATSDYTMLVDPWTGNCSSNSLTGSTSWWANQQPYYVPTLNKIMTHGSVPNMSSCTGMDTTHEKINFSDGQTIYVAGYYRDQQIGQQVNHTIYYPDGGVFRTWTQNNFTTYFSASWWYYFWSLPNPAPTGSWRYEVIYEGKKLITSFAVGSTAITICPGSMTPVYSNITGPSGTIYQWQENTGNGFVNIPDNNFYAGTASSQLQLKNIPSSYYGYQYRCQVNGSTYSHTISLKFVSYWVGYNSKDWEDPLNWSCGNVPDANTDVVIKPGTAFFPEINSNRSCRTFSAEPGVSVIVKPGANLTIER